MNDQQIEQEIQAKGLTAPRVTPADIEAEIYAEHYFTTREGASHSDAHSRYLCDTPAGYVAPLGLLTFCVLVLKNGFTVTGESACASPENFDAELGRKIARQNAVAKVWPLLGFRLRDHLAGTSPGYSATDMASQGAEGFRDGHAAAQRGEAPLDH